MPTILKITKRRGVAGETQFTANVQYPDEPISTVSFVGNLTYGGPVVMITESGHQIFVTEPSRFGEFGEAWVRRFLGEDGK